MYYRYIRFVFASLFIQSSFIIAASTGFTGAVISILDSDNKTSPLNNAVSPPFYPTPFAQRISDNEWEIALKKAEQFVAKLNLAEKVNLTSGSGWMMGKCVGNTGDIPRFDFYSLCLQDGPLGVRSTDFNSAFPAGITTGSTFNKQLMYDRGKAIGLEHKYKGVDVALGPVAGPLGLKAAAGRNWEGFAADPYLSGVACGNTVRGIQDQGVIANAKHFIGNEQEHFRQYSEWRYAYAFDLKEPISSNIDDRTLHEVYSWPFADMVRAGVGSVMCSYNQVNNSQACQNSYLLNKVLKEQLGFPGFVVSDWGALHSGVASVLAGIDMNMPGGGIVPVPPEGTAYFSTDLTLSVLNGSVPMWRLDDMAVRIMAAYYKVGRDEARVEAGPPNFSSWTFDEYDLLFKGSGQGPTGVVNEHVNVRMPFSNQISLQVAAEGVVLLKNVDDTLPLKLNSSVDYELHPDETIEKVPRKIGVLGVAAGPHPNGPNCQSDMACTDGGVMASGWGSGAVHFPFVFTPVERINSRAAFQEVVVEYNTMDTSSSGDWGDFDRIVSTSDVVIIFGSSVSGEGYLSVHGNQGDRNDLALWYGADAQINRAVSKNSNVIVVINSVGAVNLEQWIEHPNVTAVVFSGPQGEYAGEATAQVLFGEVNPSGRLPFTIAKDDNDYVPIINSLDPQDNGIPQDNFDRGLYFDYKYFDRYNITPRYEFGYGLSFSKWSFSNLEVHLLGENPPSEHLPPPPSIGPTPNYNETIPSPEELLYPKDIPRYHNFLYPYIESTSQVVKGDYPYPEGYSSVPISSPSLASGAPGGNPALWDVVYQVKATVHNNGPYGGAYVPQLYIGFPQTDKFESPIRQLRGFEKVSLEPDEWTVVNFDLMVRDLSVWDTETQSWIVQRGKYNIYVGSSSRKLELQATFTI